MKKITWIEMLARNHGMRSEWRRHAQPQYSPGHTVRGLNDESEHLRAIIAAPEMPSFIARKQTREADESKILLVERPSHRQTTSHR